MTLLTMSARLDATPTADEDLRRNALAIRRAMARHDAGPSVFYDPTTGRWESTYVPRSGLADAIASVMVPLSMALWALVFLTL